jgi:hypothetical protein
VSDELNKAIRELFEAIALAWPYDDCCLRAEGHMPTCNKWKHEVIRRAKTAEDMFHSEGSRTK